MHKFGLLHIGKTGGTAAKAVLNASNRSGAGEYVDCYPHKISLVDVRDNSLCHNLMFFIREPVARYISAFNSRLRKGYPRHPTEWTAREELAFTWFKSPNQLAEALSSNDATVVDAALAAMKGIRHIRRSYRAYLGSVDLLEREAGRIYFIGQTETFTDDFGLMRRLLKIPPEIELPEDDFGAHRTPQGFERTVSELGRKNIQEYYKMDYEIYNWCVRRREELIAIHTAEL